MELEKLGPFIAALRKDAGLTQEALGERLGVSAKTVSRWETGNSLPDIGMLQALASQFGVSLNELLAGQQLSDAELRQQADENVVRAVRSSAFTLREQQAYWRKKWLREHAWLYILLALAWLALILAVKKLLPLSEGGQTAAWAVINGAVVYAFFRLQGQMGIYVDDRVFGTLPGSEKRR